MDISNIEITKREVLASISIIAIMLLIGVMISGSISDLVADANAIYDSAVKLDSADMFEYGMRTNVGNAFICGDLRAVDTVTYPEIGGEYMRVRWIKEKYTRHTRTVTKHRTVNGKTQSYTTTEVYWTWDEVDRDSKQCNEITFLGVVFDSGKIQLPGYYHIDTIKESSHIRYKYYGVDTEHFGTIFTDLRDGTISDNTSFYKDYDIDRTVEALKFNGAVAIFWILWVVLTGAAVLGFYSFENCWLE